MGYVGPHLGYERPDRSGTTTSPLAHHLPSSATELGQASQVATVSWGLSDTEVIMPPGLSFDAGRLPHRAGGRRQFRL